MIALIGKTSFQNTLLEKQIEKSGFRLRRLDEVDTAILDQDVDVILIEHEFAGHEDFAHSEAVLIGLDVPEEHENLYDYVVTYPVDWERLAVELELEGASIFVEKTRREILGILGEDEYRSALYTLIEEIDTLILNFDALNLDEKIADIHKVSGVSAMLGADRLHRDFFSIEREGKCQNFEAMVALWASFLLNWPRYRGLLGKAVEG